MKSFRQFALVEPHDPIAKIRNLMALADRPGTEAEGLNARQKAELLAAKYGIDLSALDALQAASAAKPAPTPPSRPPTPPDSYNRLLRQFGWVREPRPNGNLVYVNPRREFSSHVIEIQPNGSWSHFMAGNLRYGGNTLADLQHHLRFNLS